MKLSEVFPPRAVINLLDYWKNGGLSLITETQIFYISRFYLLLSECLASAGFGSWLGNIHDRRTWDLFNMCKVFATAFFFLPTYRDGRRMHWRLNYALVIACFALAYGRPPNAERFVDTYSFSLHFLPAFGIYLFSIGNLFLLPYLKEYEKWHYCIAVWTTIVLFLYLGCPVFVSLIGCVSFHDYVWDCVRIAVFHAVTVEVVIALYVMDWCNTVPLIVVPMFFKTGGWNIVYRVFFGYTIPLAIYILSHGYRVPEDVQLMIALYAVVGSLFYGIYMIVACAISWKRQ